MKKYSLCCLLVMVLLAALCASAFADTETPAEEERFIEVEGSYADGYTGFIYSDDMMLGSSFELSGDLAKVSVALSGAAYSENGGNVKIMLDKMGFIDFCESYDYGERTLDDNDRVAYTIARKRLDNGKLLYCVVIRGTNGLEWFSNFDMGDPTSTINGGEHPGFQSAAEKVMATVSSVVLSDGAAPENRYILFTGHSRGAAVANIVAAHYSSDSHFASTDHIFGYTFACPAVSKAVTAYGNIFNFNNTGDAVPIVPLAD